MMTNWKNMDNATRVWIYQADRHLSLSERENIQVQSKKFLDEWTSHGSKMDAAIEIFHDLFIVIFADEAKTKASGCGIDQSVRFIQSVGDEYGIDFFNRMNVAILLDNEIHLVNTSKLEEKMKNGEIDHQSLVFNNLVRTKEELENAWLIPLASSWVVNTL